MTVMENIKISAVVFEEEGWWCAQCLEYDVAAQAATLLDLRVELERVLTSHAALAAELKRDPFFGLEKAPQKFWEMYREAKPLPRSEERYRVIAAPTLPQIEPVLRVV